MPTHQTVPGSLPGQYRIGRCTNDTILSINTVGLTQLDVTNILSLINKSYDYDNSVGEGVPTGFVTAWDYD